MLSSRLFGKLLLTCAGVNLLAAAVLACVISNWLERQAIEQVDNRLHNATYLVRGELAHLMHEGRSAELQNRVRQVGHETNTRFTLVSPDGTVLADTESDSLAQVVAMDNHGDRPEIARARARGLGNSTRRSISFGTPHRYIALRVELDGQLVGFIRASLPVTAIEAETAAVKRWTWALAAVTFALATAIAAWIISHIVRPVPALAEAASAIAAGNYEHRVYLTDNDELGTLGHALNRIRQDLSTRTTQLHQTGDRQSIVLGGMIEGVIAVDTRQRIVLANNAAGRLFNFNYAAVEGRSLAEVVRNHAMSAAVTTALATRETQRLETKPIAPSSTMTSRQSSATARPSHLHPTHIAIHVQPLPGNPCPGVVLVMHDTTELRRLESLRRDFVANVSHELKTPLSSIKAYAETLRDGAINDAELSQRFLGRIEEQSDRLHHLILDMLMLARIESDQQAFEITSVDVAQVVAVCLESHRQTADAKSITIAVTAPNEPCSVRADREGLREIFDNLIDNAIKYTPNGGQVTISWEQQPLPNNSPTTSSPLTTGATSRATTSLPSESRASPLAPRAFIRIADTGIGIKPEEQTRVFERFYRVDKARSRELGGTGLGLSIVKHLALSFGGSVTVKSTLGRGSTFTVELPLG